LRSQTSEKGSFGASKITTASDIARGWAIRELTARLDVSWHGIHDSTWSPSWRQGPGHLDNGSLLGRITWKLLVVLLDHCDRDVLVFGSSALELHATVEDDARTQKRWKRTRMPDLGGEPSRRFSDGSSYGQRNDLPGTKATVWAIALAFQGQLIHQRSMESGGEEISLSVVDSVVGIMVMVTVEVGRISTVLSNC